MNNLSAQPQQAVMLELNLHRVNCILDVVVHLFPESSESFDYDDEILALISVARDLIQDTRNQLGKEWMAVPSDLIRSNASALLPENRAVT
jgi:hypothetical protein